jgi:aminoglycoside 6-adenylyltransferase
MKQTYLVRMLEWSIGVAKGWQRPVGYLGKGLQQRLPAEQWHALQQTHVGADIGENWQALYAMMALFRQVAEQVGHALGYHYPAELHDRVVAYVRQIQQLPMA